MSWRSKRASSTDGPPPVRLISLDIQDPITIEQLDAVYLQAVETAKVDLGWYTTHKQRWWPLAMVNRVIVFVGLLLGAVLPFVKVEALSIGSVTFEGGTQLGYALLVVTGLVLGLDRIFMLSQTWVRFRDAEMKIKSRILESDWDWARMKASMSAEGAAAARSDEALGLFDAFAMDVRAVVENETKLWTTQLRESGAALRELLKSQTEKRKEQSEQENEDAEARRAKREQPRAKGLKVVIENHAKLKGTVKLAVGDRTELRTDPPSVVVVESVPFGEHKLLLEATSQAGDPVTLEDLVEVAAAKPAVVTLTIP